MKKIFFIFLYFPAVLSAQQPFFADTLTKYCLLEHLGLRATDTIPRIAFDTTSVLNCNGFGIKELADLASFPNLKSIHLSHNSIQDVTVLASLPQLRFADLSNNQLKSIDVLAFPESDTFTLVVGGNLIRDFSLFNNNAFSVFTLIGTSLQRDTNAMIRLNYLKAIPDTNNCNTFKIKYVGWTNSTMTPIIQLGNGTQVTGIADGYTHTVHYTYSNAGTYMISFGISDSIKRDTIRAEILPLPTITYRNDSLISSGLGSYRWLYNNVLLDSITTRAFKPTKSGTYKVVLKSPSGCILISAPLGIALVAVDNISEQIGIRASPNPFQETLNLEYELPQSSNVVIQLTNLTGQTVYMTSRNQQAAGKHQLQLPVNLVPNGLYLLTIKTDFGAFSSKVLKNN
jgi:Leucine-rich repeat (LRR) protein